MLGPDVNESYQKKYDDMMAGPNKFKPGDIITDFKDDLRSGIIRPAKDWVRNVGYSVTWRVNSVEPNGDYKLQRLDTLTTHPLTVKGTPIYQKEVTMSKESVDYWTQYKLWDKDYVKATYKVGLDAMSREKEVNKGVKEYVENEIAELTPKVQRYFNNSKKKYGHHTIDETYKKFDRDLPVAGKWDKIELIWNMIDAEKIKEASDYLSVKKTLFGEHDKDFQNFKKATSVILHEKNKSIPKNASTRRVLGNADLHRTIDEYFKRSEKGGKKTKKKRGK